MTYSSSRPHATFSQHHKRPGSTATFAVAFFVAGGLSVALLVFKTHHHLPSTAPATADVLNDSGQLPGRVNDVLVQEIVEQCVHQVDRIIAFAPGAKQQPVVVFTGRPKSSVEQAVAARCPSAVIPLAAGDKSIGLCTDAALYVYLLGAWIVPGSPASEDIVLHCLKPTEQPPPPHASQTRAVLFLEPLYEPWLDWLGQNPEILAVYSPNFEQMFEYDQQFHKRMQLVLCKVHRCEQLMAKYLKDLGSNATLLFTGHTSLDPHTFVVGAEAQQQTAAASAPQSSLRGNLVATAEQQQQLHLAASMQTVTALHVRGKSSLKHTKQLLDCWLTHPEWPQLTVVGPMPNEQITLDNAIQYMASGNMRFPNAGRSYGANFPEFEPIPQQELSNLQLSNALHIMPSEREGFGHSINEGRAAGGLLLVPDHPPMNELMREGSGYLIKPRRLFSHEDAPVPVLGKYANISASMDPQGLQACGVVVMRDERYISAWSKVIGASPEQCSALRSLVAQIHRTLPEYTLATWLWAPATEYFIEPKLGDICAAVSRALKLNVEERVAFGRKARQIFQQDRREFEERLKQVPVILQQLAAGKPVKQQPQHGALAHQ